MNKLGTKLGAVAMSAVMALSFAPSAAITSLAAGGDDLTDATQELSTPVYRLYNPNSGEHLFTTNENECDSLDKNGWDYETIAWYAPSTGDPVFRLYNPNHPLGDHHYTSSEEERDNLIKQGWKLDATAFNTVAEGELLGAPVYSLYNPNAYDLGMATHHLTLSEEEADGLELLGWTNEGPKFYEYAEDLDPEVEELTVSIDNTTPKVGDTIRVLIYDEEGNEINPEDVDAEIQWYADSIEITGADEAEYDVLVGDVGVKLSACVTIDGEEYWTDQTAEVEEADGQIEIVSAEATAANVIEVTLAEPINADNTTVEVTRGTSTVNIDDYDWADTNESVILTTAANMSNGTYTVTLTSDEDETNTDSADFEVTGRYVKEIVIINDIALTNADKKEAYAYYDVLDQYGDSMRTSASVTFTGSCTTSVNKTTGQITCKKNNGAETWVYNDQIYLTGVYTKTGVTCQKTLTVGTEQSLDSVELKGFVKKGTTEILDSLPAGFAADTYYLIYNTKDQNGNPLKVGAAKGAVTFVSDSVLVVKQIDAPINNGLVIAGEEYEASYVQPGIKVQDGGTVTVTAIATKTGNKSELTFEVAERPVIASFTFGSPAGVVADGDADVEIPFVALDADGNTVTDFDTIARQKTFNELTLSASEGELRLVEEDDGTAKLLWSDATLVWSGDSFNDIDRPINLTAVVVGGESDNTMLSVSDARRPDAIAEVNADSVYVEGAAITFGLDSFKFYDQYGELIGSDFGDDNGFFKYASTRQTSPNSDFNNYQFGVRVEYAGSNEIKGSTVTVPTGTTYADTAAFDATTKQAIVLWDTSMATSTVTFDTETDIDKVAANEGFKFEIAKNSNAANAGNGKAENWESASTKKYVQMAVVDVSQVKNIGISDLNRFYTGKLSKDGDGTKYNITGSGIVGSDGLDAEIKVDATSGKVDGKGAKGGLVDEADYQQTLELKGTYNGEEVTIPETYFTVAGSKLSDGMSLTQAAPFDGTVDTLVIKADGTAALKATDLYDKTSAKGTSKIAKDTLKARVHRLYGTAKEVVFADTVTAGVGGDEFSSTQGSTASHTVAINSSRTLLQTTFATAMTDAGTKYPDWNTPAGTNYTTDLAAYAKVLAHNTALFEEAVIYDTASVEVEISDQAPKATKINNVLDAYTLHPTLTGLNANGLTDGLKAILEAEDDLDDPIEVVDQYGVTMAAAVITMKATNLTENPAGFKDNNLKVSGNDGTQIAIDGAELGDTFDLVLSSGSISETATVTIGADTKAYVTSQGSVNAYRDQLLPKFA